MSYTIQIKWDIDNKIITTTTKHTRHLEYDEGFSFHHTPLWCSVSVSVRSKKNTNSLTKEANCISNFIATNNNENDERITNNKKITKLERKMMQLKKETQTERELYRLFHFALSHLVSSLFPYFLRFLFFSRKQQSFEVKHSQWKILLLVNVLRCTTCSVHAVAFPLKTIKYCCSVHFLTAYIN